MTEILKSPPIDLDPKGGVHPLIDLPADPLERLQVIANAIRSAVGTDKVFSPQIAIADAVDALNPTGPARSEGREGCSPYNLCDGTGLVCENHPNLAWGGASNGTCTCDCGAGKACEGCISCAGKVDRIEKARALLVQAMRAADHRHPDNGYLARDADLLAEGGLGHLDTWIALDVLASALSSLPPEPACSSGEEISDNRLRSLNKDGLSGLKEISARERRRGAFWAAAMELEPDVRLRDLCDEEVDALLNAALSQPVSGVE